MIAGIIVWLLILDWVFKGKDLRSKMSKREIAKLSGYVAWYARNVKGLLPEVLFTIFHMFSFLFVADLLLLVLAPSDVSYTLNLTLNVLPFLILFSFMAGIPARD
jgi:hypothetical protein